MRYSLVSVVAVAVNQIALVALFGAAHWSARSANITACAIAAIPSYLLNRRWAWGKTGRSRVFREIVPFWVLAFLGLALSTFATTWAEGATDAYSRLTQTVTVALASLSAFGVLWVAKFVIFERVLFAPKPGDPAERPA